MDFTEGVTEQKSAGFSELLAEENIGKELRTEGMIHSIRDMGEVEFLILRSREGLFQTVWEKEKTKLPVLPRESMAVRAAGILRAEERAPHGRELYLTGLQVLSEPAGPLPVAVDKWKLTIPLAARLDTRAISLRNIRERSKFRIQEGIIRAFREFLGQNGFTEIHTPKTGAIGAEGGANIFHLDYFHRPAVLAQSPQFYKQMMVGVFDRVFETGPVFRAEKHSTKRHLNEYTSLDLEMGFIDSFRDLIGMETGFLQHMTAFLKEHYPEELRLLKTELPRTDRIPVVRFSEAKELAAGKYGRKMKNPYDLEPEEESLIGRYFQEEYGADFVFITHYPSRKRPFYAMDDPEDASVTLSFDLLFRGLEVTTGGQRIHDYQKLREKIAARGMSEEGLEHYLEAFRCGLPPHGGLGIGLERMTMQLLKEENVRETCLFPRDRIRLAP